MREWTSHMTQSYSSRIARWSGPVHLLAILLIMFSTPTFAQRPIPSPRDSTVLLFGKERIAIDYGRPSMSGRRIMGEFVPYNKIWRTGAGKSTTLETTTDLRIGDIEIPHGRYSLYTLPSELQWKLIINKQTDQWGTVYNGDLDFGRTDLRQRRLREPVERLTISLEKNGAKTGILRIEWEYASLWVRFEVLEDSFIASPRDSVSIDFGGSRLAIHYGRPYRRGRTVIGKVVPYNEVWRTGANEATIFSTDANLLVGGIQVPKGEYSLYSLPSVRSWKLIINKQTGQLGTQYDRALDLARIPLQREAVQNPIDQFTILFERTGENSCLLRLLWEYTSLSVPIEVLDGYTE